MLWAAWYPYVQPELPGAPLPLIDHYLRQSAIHFLEESQVWTLSLDAVDLVADTGTYNLTVPASVTTGGDVSMVKWVWVDGYQIYPASLEELGTLDTSWDTTTAGAVRRYTQLTQDTITLWPIPNYSSTDGLVIKVALRPSLTATGVPDWIGTKYIQEVAMKTKADMMGMIGQSWSNTEGETKYNAAYASALTKATVEGIKSFTRTSMAVRFRNYG